MTPVDLAEALDVSASSVRRWIAEGRLDAVRVGGRLRLAPESFERMVQRVSVDQGAGGA